MVSVQLSAISSQPIHDTRFTQAPGQAHEGTPQNQTQWEYLAQELIQAIYEVSGRERPLLSLDAPVSDGTVVGELTADTSASSPDTALLEEATRRQAQAALHTLNERERRVLELRHGIANSREHTIQEIADRMGCSPARVRQLERLAQTESAHSVGEACEFPSSVSRTTSTTIATAPIPRTIAAKNQLRRIGRRV